MTSEPDPLPIRTLLLRGGVLIVAVILANLAFSALVERLFPLIDRQAYAGMIQGMMLWMALCYAVLLALPFVPGVEIGLALLAMFGAEAAALVYLATLAGLSLAFLVGRLLPVRWMAAGLRFLGAMQMAADFEASEALSGVARVERLLQSSPKGAARFLLRHRGWALVVALNLPGNSILGGGGGIAMLAGLSRVYSAPRFICLCAAAVAPLPLAVALFGRLTQ